MADPIDTRAFEAMTTAVDKTAVSLFEPEDEKGTKGIHNALLAAGMTPAYGNIADVADATYMH